MENDIVILKNVVYKTDKGTPVTDSLKVAQVIGRQHKNVIRSIRDIMMSANLLANRQTFCESTYYDSQGKQQPIFLMTKEGFCALVMRWNGEKANQFKMAFIEMLSKIEKAFQQVKPQHPAIPQTFAEALRLAAEQAEEIERKQKQIEANAPKVQYFDKCIERNGATNFRDTAKLLGYQQNAFINYLLMSGYIYRDNKHRLRPYAEYVDKGYFEVKEYASESSNGVQTLITAKGREYFSQRDFSM